MPDGSVVLELPRRWTDGTTHLIFDPVELLERRGGARPAPAGLYYGVLAPRAAWRRAVVPDADPRATATGDDPSHGMLDSSVAPAWRAPNRT